MRILGIDPGLAIVGYGIIDVEGNKNKIVDYGVIETDSKSDLPTRLEEIFNLITQLLENYRPDELAIEELFFSKNVKTALSVGHARGVEILACKLYGLEAYEYTPLQIKQAITGFGRADKKQVQYMVKNLLNLKEIPKPDDASDALAVALTHGSSSIFKEEFKMR